MQLETLDDVAAGLFAGADVGKLLGDPVDAVKDFVAVVGKLLCLTKGIPKGVEVFTSPPEVMMTDKV